MWGSTGSFGCSGKVLSLKSGDRYMCAAVFLLPFCELEIVHNGTL